MIVKLSIIFILLAGTAFSQLPPIEPGVSHELAKWRALQYSNISYKLTLTLEKMSPVLRGSMEIHVTQAAYACAEPHCPPMAIILDWRKIVGHEKESTVKNITLNEIPLFNGDQYPVGIAPSPAFAYHESSDHLILAQGARMGENVIKLDFTSPILTSGSAITRYVDKEDGAEYIYSLFVPSDASTAFPVFDQPDLKARFTLSFVYPEPWKIVSNTFRVRSEIWDCNSRPGVPDPPRCSMRGLGFAETKPISTYVFAFAAGPFEAFENKGGNPSSSEGAPRATSSDLRTLPTGRVSAFDGLAKTELKAAYNPSNSEGAPSSTSSDLRILPTGWVSASGDETRIYVRRSQAAKFKPHATEVFRLTREGIKYLETYFDYKFPFPKYDLVLIPEFPFGGMEHAGATFLREASVIFPQEPTKNDFISRANLIFHETAHQWFGDTVTMKWFDDLWLKEGFAEFMAYKTLESVMPESNAWKVFYERNKQAAYLTDSTKGTTPIYQEIANLNSAKSAYGNIVYRKAPSFLRQAEFYLGPDKFQTAVRAFLKKNEYANAGWEDLVTEFETVSGRDLKVWAENWVKKPGLTLFRYKWLGGLWSGEGYVSAEDISGGDVERKMTVLAMGVQSVDRGNSPVRVELTASKNRRLYAYAGGPKSAEFLYYFPNIEDYGYGIFLLDDKSRDYVLKNIQNEKDDFLRTMMWGSLWDSVREGELDPKDYVELVVKNLSSPAKATDPKRLSTTPSAAAAATPPIQGGEQDEGTIQTLLGRVSTALNYYMPKPPAAADGALRSDSRIRISAGRTDLRTRVENLLIDKMQNASTPGQKITYYRSFLSIASTARARDILKQILKGGNPSGSEGVSTSKAKNTLPAARVSASTAPPMRTKDRFDIVAKLIMLGDPEAPRLLAELEKTETSDDARRYAYAARAGFATGENKAKYWNDFLSNKDISESWIEAAMVPFNSVRQSDLTIGYLEKALAELPNLKRNRKIFFVNGWLGAFIGGQKSEAALAVINKFLAENPKLDNDLRLKILENADLIERAVKIRNKFAKS